MSLATWAALFLSLLLQRRRTLRLAGARVPWYSGIAGMEDPERPLAGSAIAVVLMGAVYSGVEVI
jgi:hypothetical protein